MRTCLLIVLHIAVLTLSCGNAGAEQGIADERNWIRTYEPLRIASIFAIQPLPNGHSILLVRGDRVTVLMEIDRSGTVIESRKVDLAASVLATNRAGEIFLAANQEETGGAVATKVLKLDRRYQIAWCRIYRVALGIRSGMTTILPMTDGGVVVTMTSDLSSGIVRLGAQGSVLWSKQYERSGGERIRATALASRGDILLAGDSQASGWLARLTADGQLQWQKHYRNHSFSSVMEDRQQSIVAVSERFAVVKTDPRGNVLWAKECDDCGTRLNYGRQVLLLPDGTYLVTAATSGPRRVLLTLGTNGTLRTQVTLSPGQRQVGVPELAAASEAVVTRSGIVFAPPLQRRGGQPGSVVVLSLDPSKPPTGCAWYSNPGIKLKDVLTAGDPITVEEHSLPVQATDATAALDVYHVAGLVTTCDEAPETSESLWNPAGPPAAVSSFRHDVEKPNREAWLRLLQQREFSKLDTIAAGLLEEKGGADPTRWRISHFYRGVVDFDFSEAERLPLLKAWTVARPTSPFAAMSYARGLQFAAANRRGGGYADTVTESGWREHEALMKQSAAVLDAHPAKDDPQWWLMRIVVTNALGTGDVRDIAREATRYVDEPLVFNTAASFTIPRWGGSEEKFVKFIGEIADLTRKTHGDAMYFYLAYQLIFVEDVFALRKYPFDLARLRKGGTDMIALNPKWITAYHRVAKLAHSLEDKETAVAMFARPELAWYQDAEGVWGSRVMYDIGRQWALGITNDSRVGIGAVSQQQQGPREPGPFLVPQFKGDPSQWPQIVMPVETTIDGRTVRHVAFVASTLSGKLVVSALPYDYPDQPVNLVLNAEQMQSRLHAPSGPVSVLGAEGREPLPKQRVVRLRLADERIPTTPALEARPVNPRLLSFNKRVLIVGCEFVDGKCRQKTIEGSIGLGGGLEGSIRTVMVNVPGVFDREGFTGAPVLDEDGYVILVTNRSPVIGPVEQRRGIGGTLSTEDFDHVIAKW